MQNVRARVATGSRLASELRQRGALGSTVLWIPRLAIRNRRCSVLVWLSVGKRDLPSIRFRRGVRPLDS